MMKWRAYTLKPGASGVCASLWKLRTSSTEVFVQRWTGADRRLFKSDRPGEKKKNKKTKPIKQWSTVFDVSRLLIGERGTLSAS